MSILNNVKNIKKDRKEKNLVKIKDRNIGKQIV